MKEVVVEGGDLIFLVIALVAFACHTNGVGVNTTFTSIIIIHTYDQHRATKRNGSPLALIGREFKS
jgi:hypothetical protein